MRATKNRVAIYAATFIPIVDIEDCVESQIEYCKAVITTARPSYIIVGLYKDEVRSFDARRPSFEKLLVDAQNRKFDFVALTNLNSIHPIRKKRREFLDQLGNLKIYILKVNKPKKKKSQNNEPRHIKWIPDPEMLSLFDAMAGEKTVDDHESEFGSSQKENDTNKE